jgi:RNA polymerase sigma-70 factor (ECF subfamily)
MPPALTWQPSGRAAAPSDTQITEWALAARGGDGEAFERFVRATRIDVWRFVAHLCADAQGAEDLAQETYLRTLTALPRFEGRSCARTWLLSIARRVVADRYRAAAARPRLTDGPNWHAEAERSQPGGLPGFEEGVALLDLLSSLDAPRRQAFVLTQVLGLPYAVAADAVGCPIGTIRSRVARARAVMTSLLHAAEDTSQAGGEPRVPRPTR